MDQTIGVLKKRFEAHKTRHPDIEWEKVEERLRANPQNVESLAMMEKTGGEPDVVGYDKKADVYTFYDCSPESPKGRRSLCYDRAAWESRKEHKPRGSALEEAEAMGARLVTVEEYKALQSLGPFDTKTSSWVHTPNDVRDLGGALFGDYRYETVFIYHNGAESYYAARGFRAILTV